ncbi:hypothetical protein ABZU25_19240 [Micromonospora sp. NPDC005215]|uniref:hypothetical protein n=1 Tax=Micromonospora sp. NPDC005215 TaxID=3157024 RepID=UPI0033A4109B
MDARTVRVMTGTLIIVAITLSACSAGPVDTPERGGYAEALRRGANGQATALKDSQVTEDEYRTAVTEMVECARGAGLIVSEPRPDGTGILLNYDFSVPDGSDADEREKAHDACYRMHLEIVSDEYLAQRRSLFEAKEKALFDTVVECMKERGAETGRVNTQDGAEINRINHEWPEEFVICHRQVFEPGSS